MGYNTPIMSTRHRRYFAEVSFSSLQGLVVSMYYSHIATQREDQDIAFNWILMSR